MKKRLDIEIGKRYAAYIAQIRSYCEVVGVTYVEPTVSQFLAANALTRDRLMVAVEDEKKSVATSSAKSATAEKSRNLMSFAAHVRQQETTPK